MRIVPEPLNDISQELRNAYWERLSLKELDLPTLEWVRDSFQLLSDGSPFCLGYKRVCAKIGELRSKPISPEPEEKAPEPEEKAPEPEEKAPEPEEKAPEPEEKAPEPEKKVIKELYGVIATCLSALNEFSLVQEHLEEVTGFFMKDPLNKDRQTFYSDYLDRTSDFYAMVREMATGTLDIAKFIYSQYKK